MAAEKRPQKYRRWITDDGAEKIRGWVADGLTDSEIAARMGITKYQLSAWRRKYPAIRSALYRRKITADGKEIDAHDEHAAPARKLDNVARVAEKVQTYIDQCRETDTPLTKPGLALALDIDTERLNMYLNDDSPKNATPAEDVLSGKVHLFTVADVLKKAMTAIEADLAVRMIGRNSTGAIFAAKNWCGYADKQETTVHHDNAAALTSDEITGRIQALLRKAGGGEAAIQRGGK